MLFYTDINSTYPILDNIISNDNGNNVYQHFEQHLRQQLYSFFPPQSRLPKSRVSISVPDSPPWWNEDCQAAVVRRKEATRAYRRHPTLANYLTYKRIRNSCSKFLKKQKRLGWRKYCSQFNAKTPTTELWSLVKMFKKRKANHLFPQTDALTHSSMVNDCISKLCNPSCLHVKWDSLSAFIEEDANSASPTFTDLDLPFTESELSLALENIKFNSAPGLDQIDNTAISHLPPEYRQLLLQTYNRFLSEGTFPHQWRQSLIVLIPKPGNTGIRPISLLSCLSKVMEKMIYTSLQWFIESRHIIPDSQTGFRPDRSCVDNLVILSSAVHKGFINNSPTVCAFLDITGAFDNVIPNILIQELRNIGIPARTRRFIQNLIGERHLHFVNDGQIKGPFYSHKGTPQGSILSPLLFAIYLRDINMHLHVDSNILLYADDIVIYSSNRDIHKAHQSVQISLNLIADYLKWRVLDLSPGKSKWMVFTRARILPTINALKIFDNPVPRVYEVRFLGVIMDKHLSGGPHYRYLIRKGSSLLDILTSLAGTWWGSHPQTLLNLYRSIFRGSLEYGCPIFKFHRYKSVFIKLQRLQFRAIRIAMGYRISTPINTMLFEAREIPLKYRFTLLTRKYLIKCMSRDFNPVIESLNTLRQAIPSGALRVKWLNSIPILKHFVYLYHYRDVIHRSPFTPFYFYDLEVTLFSINPSFDMYPTDNNLSQKEIRKLFLEKSFSARNNAISFYTDGSKLDSESPAGAAVFSPDLNWSIGHKLPSETSIFSAEAWATLQAINASLDFNCSKAAIFTDSKSVLEALSSTLPPSRNYLIYRIKKRLLDAFKGNKEIILFWLPAHRSIPGNERADELAKKAARSGSKPWFKVPYMDIFSEFRESLGKQFSEYLKESARVTRHLHSLLYQHDISPKPWYYDKPINRNDIVLINRIRSNHYNLNYSLFRKKMVDSAACQCGESRQDINHIIFYCPLTIPKSLHLRTFLIKSYPHSPIDIMPILDNPSPKLIRLMTAFFKANDIKI